MPPKSNVSLDVEIPQELHERIQSFLEANPAWNQADFVTSAFSLMLVQLGDTSKHRDARIYLDQMFYRLWGKEVS